MSKKARRQAGGGADGRRDPRGVARAHPHHPAGAGRRPMPRRRRISPSVSTISCAGIRRTTRPKSQWPNCRKSSKRSTTPSTGWASASPMNEGGEACPKTGFRALLKTMLLLESRAIWRRHAMKWEEFRQSDNVEDRRGDRPIRAADGTWRRRGHLGLGAMVVLGLIGYAFGIDPRLLIGGAEMVSQGDVPAAAQQAAPSPARWARPRTRWAVSSPPCSPKTRTSGKTCCRPRPG